MGLLLAAGCATIPPVPVTPFIDGRNFVLYEPLVYQRGNSTNSVIVPDGFVADFASIPRAFWVMFAPTGRYQWAAVVHDHLYWEQTTTREEADNLFLAAMIESGVSQSDRTFIYEAVRSGGDSAWRNNQKERQQGLPRIIPPQYRKIPANTTWEEYRKFLYDRGVRP